LIDVERARRDTPGVGRVAHFNHAGASLMPQPVLDAVVSHLRLEAEIGGYEAADAASESIERTYVALARLLGCDPDEIAIVGSATRAWDMVFYGLRFEHGDRVLISRTEYGSHAAAYWQVARRTGIVVDLVPVDEYGRISLDALEQMIDERVRVISLAHCPDHDGLINPAAEVGRIARRSNALYILDACQSVGQVPIDVASIGCDVLTAAGRKFLRGPRGTGFLYVRRTLIESIEPPMLDLRAADWVATDEFRIRPDARRFEDWEADYAARIGLGVAAEYALSCGLEAIQDRVNVLAESLRTNLSEVRGVTVLDRGIERSGIVAFTTQQPGDAEVVASLSARGINVRLMPMTVLGRYDHDARGLDTLIRASVHYFNDEDEIDRLVAAVRDVVKHM